MKYEGLIVVCLTTGAVVGGYPAAGLARDYTRLGAFFGEDAQDNGDPAINEEATSSILRGGYAVVRVEGEV